MMEIYAGIVLIAVIVCTLGAYWTTRYPAVMRYLLFLASLSMGTGIVIAVVMWVYGWWVFVEFVGYAAMIAACGLLVAPLAKQQLELTRRQSSRSS